MARLPHTSKHRVGKKLVEVPRRFDDAHIEAGYHKQEMGEPSHPDHDLHGAYATTRGRMVISHIEGEPAYGLRCVCGAKGEKEGFAEHVEKAHVEQSDLPGRDEADALPEPHRVLIEGSPTVGAEFKLEWDDGSALTVPCADTVRLYLKELSAIRRDE